MKTLILCANCNKERYIWNYQINKAKYCSTKCASIGRWNNPTKKMLNSLINNQMIMAKKRIGMKHTKVSKDKMSLNRIGKCTGIDNCNWKGGITPYKQKIYHSNMYNKWRKAVFERDDFTCRSCGYRCGDGFNINLEVHHRIPTNKLINTKFEKYIFNLDNGITLCRKCHNKTLIFHSNQYVK
jgi:hypothetical protein